MALYEILELPLEDGQTVKVEVDARTGIVPSARPGEVVAKASESFQSALERLAPVTEAILARFRNLAARPTEVDIEFGIKLSAGAGVVIAHTGAEANFKVTVQWRQT
jgi:hypothetical protein